MSIHRQRQVALARRSAEQTRQIELAHHADNGGMIARQGTPDLKYTSSALPMMLPPASNAHRPSITVVGNILSGTSLPNQMQTSLSFVALDCASL